MNEFKEGYQPGTMLVKDMMVIYFRIPTIFLTGGRDDFLSN
jgi:hypothetical protein